MIIAVSMMIYVQAGFSPVYNTLGASTKCNVDKGN